MNRRPSDAALSTLVAVIFAAGWIASWFLYGGVR